MLCELLMFANMYIFYWIVVGSWVHLPVSAYKLPHLMRVIDGNCQGTIFARREPLVEVYSGMAGWPMVEADGTIANAWWHWRDSWPDRIDGKYQTYTNSWSAKSGHTGILYAYWAPLLKSEKGNLRYFVLWFYGQTADWDKLYGCSAFGSTKTEMRWVHFNRDVCTADGLGEGDDFRVKIVMDGRDVWPGNKQGVRSHLSELLLWPAMPQAALNALKGFRWYGPGIIFEEGQWETQMNDLFYWAINSLHIYG